MSIYLSSACAQSRPMVSKPNSAKDERSRRVRDPVSTRARILAEAERLFAERGFEGVSMPAIAAAAGITPGAIYRHFDGKTELFFQVIGRAVDAAAAPALTATAGIGAIPAMVADFAAGPQERLRQMAVEVHYVAAKNPQVRCLLRRCVDRDASAMAAGFAAAQAAGAMASDPDPALLAVAVLVFIMGQMHLGTLAPQLVGNAAWRAFVEERVACLLGLHRRS
jgi:AcrR family transcriptional regulator